jgi:dihydroxy-acid dehydratase
VQRVTRTISEMLPRRAGFETCTSTVGTRRLEAELSHDDLAKRRAAWQPSEPTFRRGWLARYTRLVTNASNGAVLV